MIKNIRYIVATLLFCMVTVGATAQVQEVIKKTVAVDSTNATEAIAPAEEGIAIKIAKDSTTVFEVITEEDASIVDEMEVDTSTTSPSIIEDGRTIEKVIAKVGGEYILYSELMGAFQYQKQNTPEITEEALCPILEQMIAQRILINQAKLDSIIVSDNEIEGQLDARITNILGMMGNDEERFVEYYGKSIVEVKEDFREDIKQQLLAERIQRTLINEVVITPNEVKEFYDKIPKDSLPYLPSEVEISEIIMKPEVNEVEATKSKTKLTEIKDKILAGEETFEDMARKFSADPGSGANGGDLGWSKRGSFVTEFEAAAYDLDLEEISDIVETQFGYHIIKLIDRRGNQLNLKHILIKPEITQDDLNITKSNLDSIRTLLSADSLDFVNAVRLHSDKETQSYNNIGRMANPKTGDTFFETGDLPPEIYFAIEELEVGDVSEPLEFQTPRGETRFRIVKLMTRTKPHKANMEQDYSRIQRFARESKRNEYYNKWMKARIEETFIELDDDFSDCSPTLNSMPK